MGNLRPVAVAGKMREENVTEPVGADFSGESGGGIVAEMAVPAHDALLERPRPDRVILKQLHIVVGFEHEHVHGAHSFDNKFGGVAEVGEHADRMHPRTDRIADRVVGIMRDAEGFDGEIADFKRVAGREQAPGDFLFLLAGHRFGGEAIGVDRDDARLAEHAEAAGVVAVFMREQNRVEIHDRSADGGEALGDLSAAQAGIDKNRGVFRFDECAVTGAAAA